MARMEGAIICLLIVVMDVVAGVLGIKAEEAQSKVLQGFKYLVMYTFEHRVSLSQGKHLRLFFLECKEHVHQAYKLGLAATALLALSHVIVNVLGGCPCACSGDGFRRSSPNKLMAAATLLLSWIVVIVGLTMLIIGAISNSESRPTCGLAHPRFLFIGGIMCFVHSLFCIVYYVSAIASWKEGKAHRDTRSQEGHA
ncbi:protein VASCULATURE COMPLEXITY AND CONNECTIVITY isoform X1 [Musa acuminata AAA Group]|uniref:protein VASCULATURE COMPLEXITY AND CONNECTIVITY isoform X1 n=1 Tax=Musa acuminata AAA Group TaxID=214697 RepID=UPI0031E1CC0E